MPLQIADRIRETTTTTGTGAITLAGAATGFGAFSSVCAVGDTCYYALQAVDGSGNPTGVWETGLGTYSATNTLTRTTVLSSSNAGAAVTLPTGTTQVWLDLPASQFIAALNGPKWQGGTYTGLLATRCKAPNAVAGTGRMHMSRSIHVARTNITQIGVAFANWYTSDNDQGESNTGGNCNIQAAIEYPLGSTCYRLLFGGANTGLCYDWQTIASDLLTLSIPAGAQFAVREYRDCTIGAGFPTFNLNGSIQLNTSSGDCYAVAASGITNSVMTPGTFTSSGQWFSMPVAIFGPTNMPSYALIGGSTAEGYNDTYVSTMDVGVFARVVGPLRAYTNLARYGESTATANGAAYRQRMAIIRKYCTHVLSNYGYNDIFTNGTTASPTLLLLEQIRARLPNQYFYQTTQQPDTTSTDSWATTTHQTTQSNEQARVFFNNFLRGGQHGFDAAYDVDSYVESAINSGLWKPNYCVDGTHYTPTVYAGIASSGIIKVV